MNGSRPLSRPKRAGDDFSRVHLQADGEPSSKRARFDTRNPSTLAADAEEEDAILDLDEIGRKGTQIKRNAVELDGYESDSSTENFDTRAEAKAASERKDKKKLEKSKDEEENDMFADLDEDFADGDADEDLEREGKKNKKQVKFLDADKIEGQVLSSKSGGHISADFRPEKVQDGDSSSSDDEGDDEERDRLADGMDEELGAGSKKKYAPKVDAFNMRNEEEEGKFDESGNFVRKANDPFALHDAWLVGAVSKTDMKRAKEAHEKREEERRKKNMEDDAIPASTILATLISRLQLSETVLEALARLASTKEKKKTKWQKNKRKVGTEMDLDTEAAPPEDAAETKRREAVEAITAAADQLLTRGQTDIYEAEREALMRQYRREAGEDWVDAEETKQENDISKEWEYRWSDARDGGEHHGPYDGPTMATWSEAGYFGDGVEFREIGGEGWSRAVDFV